MLPFPSCFARNKACVWGADDSSAIRTGGERLLGGVEQTGARLSSCSTESRQAAWDGTIFTVPILPLITSLSDG